LVTAVGVGNTSITVACGETKVPKDVVVLEEGSTAEPALAFEGGASQEVSVSVDGSLELRVSTGDTYSSSNQPDGDVEWSLVSESAPGVVTLSPNGLVTLNAVGSATIRATVGNDSADLRLTIVE